MNRCADLSLALALAGTLAALAPATASAQFVGPTEVPQGAQAPLDGQALHRNFPQSALRGKIGFGQPPVITMNGVVTRMAVGYRVHGSNNLIVMSAQLNGGTATVNYTRDVEGHVYEVWILSPWEASRLWPMTPTQAAAWAFDPVANTWTQP